MSNRKWEKYRRSVLMKQRAIARLGGKCVRCGFTDIRALQIDHKNGGGNREIKKIASWGIYRKIVAGKTAEYQLLCANCNWIKRSERKEVTHGHLPKPISRHQRILISDKYRQILPSEAKQ